MPYLEKSDNHKTAKKNGYLFGHSDVFTPPSGTNRLSSLYICAYTCENIRLCHSVKLLMFLLSFKISIIY